MNKPSGFFINAEDYFGLRWSQYARAPVQAHTNAAARGNKEPSNLIALTFFKHSSTGTSTPIEPVSIKPTPVNTGALLRLRTTKRIPTTIAIAPAIQA